MSTWTQPVCAPCFTRARPGRQPVRVRDAETERCCLCDQETSDGIYIRVDPAAVPYPREDPDGD